MWFIHFLLIFPFCFYRKQGSCSIWALGSVSPVNPIYRFCDSLERTSGIVPLQLLLRVSKRTLPFLVLKRNPFEVPRMPTFRCNTRGATPDCSRLMRVRLYPKSPIACGLCETRDMGFFFRGPVSRLSVRTNCLFNVQVLMCILPVYRLKLPSLVV